MCHVKLSLSALALALALPWTAAAEIGGEDVDEAMNPYMAALDAEAGPKVEVTARPDLKWNSLVEKESHLPMGLQLDPETRRMEESE
ncbi:MAG: hypothetical protein ACE366_22485 [Bradymonadia bacterium]